MFKIKKKVLKMLDRIILVKKARMNKDKRIEAKKRGVINKR